MEKKIDQNIKNVQVVGEEKGKENSQNNNHLTLRTITIILKKLGTNFKR